MSLPFTIHLCRDSRIQFCCKLFLRVIFIICSTDTNNGNECYFVVDMRVAPLVVIIKDWSKQCGINNAPAGYLSSYSVVLMVIFFLQCKCAVSECELQGEGPVFVAWRVMRA